jgi:hypothetical protein
MRLLCCLLVGAVEALPLEIMVSSRMCSFIRASMVVSCALSFEIVGLQRQSAKQQCAVACSLFDLWDDFECSADFEIQGSRKFNKTAFLDLFIDQSNQNPNQSSTLYFKSLQWRCHTLRCKWIREFYSMSMLRKEMRASAKPSESSWAGHLRPPTTVSRPPRICLLCK